VDLVEVTSVPRAALALGLVLTAPYCGPDLRLAATDLEISPNPAQAGDAVSFSFTLTVIPEQGYTVIALIDGTERTRVSGFESVDGPFVIDVGDAGDLISQYGLGTHLGAVEVRLQDQSRTATANRTFVLREPPPPTPVEVVK
jgi:hypothetical protein